VFLPNEIESVNTLDQLPRGRYCVTREGYVSRRGGQYALMYTYLLEGDEFPLACDLLFIEAGGAARQVSFVRMPDGAWRDSFGAKADDLRALLPQEVCGYQLVSKDDLDYLNLENHK
jgi:hypothetical protein